MKVELSCSTPTATCNYSSLPGFSLPVSYLLPIAAAQGRRERKREREREGEGKRETEQIGGR